MFGGIEDNIVHLFFVPYILMECIQYTIQTFQIQNTTFQSFKSPGSQLKCLWNSMLLLCLLILSEKKKKKNLMYYSWLLPFTNNPCGLHFSSWESHGYLKQNVHDIVSRVVSFVAEKTSIFSHSITPTKTIYSCHSIVRFTITTEK